MKRFLIGLLTAFPLVATAQIATNFQPGQVLTAAQLNAAFAAAVNINNGVMTGNLQVPSLNVLGAITSLGVPLSVSNGGTGSTTATGSGQTVLATSPTLITPNLGTPTSVVLTHATGLPVSGMTGLGSGVGAALASSVTGSGGIVLANSPALVTPALGVPSSGVLTNATGLPVSTGLTGAGTGVITALGQPVTGSGSIVLGTAPTITLSNGTGLPVSTGITGLGAGIATALAATPTGSGSVVLATSPTLTAPTITGRTTGTCAANPNVGQCLSSNIPSGSAIALTTGVAKDVTSLSLTAGNWLVAGNVCFSPGGTAVTSTFNMNWLSTVSATLPTAPNQGAETINEAPVVLSNGVFCQTTGTTFYTVSTTTTLYMSAFSNFSGTSPTMSVFGYMFALRFN